MSRTHFAPALLLAVASFACSGWGEDGVARLSQLYPQAPSANSNGATCAMPDNPDAGAATDPTGSCLGLLNGQWAARFVEFGNISPLGPPAWNVTITDLFLVSLSADKSSLQLTFCQEENGLTDNTGNVQMLGQNVTPSALVTALAKTPLVIPLPGDGTLQANQVVWLWGLQGLTNPATDPVPTSPDAGTVWDQDMDGHPGVTVDVTDPAGELYIVKRALFDFQQGSVGQDWFTGTMDFTLTQNPMGASLAALANPEPITPRPECASQYQFRCVEPTFTCADLVQNYQTLFINAPK